MADCQEYEGEWADNLKNAFGAFTFEDGSTCIAEHKKDYKWETWGCSRIIILICSYNLANSYFSINSVKIFYINIILKTFF